MRLDNLRDSLPIRLPSSRVLRIVCPQVPIFARRQPHGVPTGVGFSVDIRPWPNNHIQAYLLGKGHDGREVVGPRVKVEDALGRIVVAP